MAGGVADIYLTTTHADDDMFGVPSVFGVQEKE